METKMCRTLSKKFVSSLFAVLLLQALHVDQAGAQQNCFQVFTKSAGLPDGRTSQQSKQLTEFRLSQVETDFLTFLSKTTSQGPSNSGNPFLDFLRERLNGSIDYVSTLTSSLQSIASAREATEKFIQSSGDSADTQSMSVVQDFVAKAEQTAQMMDAVVRSFELAQGFRKNLPTNSKLMKEAPQMELSLRQAKSLLRHSERVKQMGSVITTGKFDKPGMIMARKQLAEAELARLNAYEEFEREFLDRNQVLITELKERIQNLEKEDVVHMASPRSDSAIGARLIESYRRLLDEKTLVGYGAATLNLSVVERLAINVYTEGGYLSLNSALWAGEPKRSEVTPFTRILVTALKKIPAHVGIVHRKAKLDATALAEHSVGNIVEYLGFTSTSIDNGFVSSNSKQQFIIYSKTGRPIMNFSYHLVENEVLFLPGTKFEIFDRTDHEDGTSIIKMREI